MIRLAMIAAAGVLMAGFAAPAAKAGDFSLGISIGGDRYCGPAYSSYYYDDCYYPAPVVVRPYPVRYYAYDCGPRYYSRPARYYSVHRRPAYYSGYGRGHVGHHRGGGRAYYRR